MKQRRARRGQPADKGGCCVGGRFFNLIVAIDNRRHCRTPGISLITCTACLELAEKTEGCCNVDMIKVMQMEVNYRHSL